MCGVVGIFGHVDLRQIQVPLQLLTHRGQDATGIAWLSDNGIKVQKCTGSIGNMQIENHNTSVCIGSTRYPTSGNAGDDMEKVSQPFVAQSKYGQICLTHNGNITNVYKIMDMIHKKDFVTDTEFITYLIAKMLDDNNGNVKDTIKQFMNTVDGAYSITCILNDKLLVFRDPNGLRPLFLGGSQTHFIASSEPISMQLPDIEFVREVEPGELVVISKQGVESSKLVDKKHAHCMFEFVYFSHPSSTIAGKNVYETRMRLGENLAKEIIKKGIMPDFVAAVPETSRPAAIKMAEVLGIPYIEALIRNRYADSRTFIMKDQQTRHTYTYIKYTVNEHMVKGKSVLIVDDSVVRGITAQRIVEILRKHGAKEVHFAVTCPPIISPCYYGIDFATKGELIAHEKTIDAIRNSINADSLTYQSIDGLKNALGLNDLCTACLTGDYPTPFGKELVKLAESKIVTDDTRHYQQIVNKHK